MAGDLLASTIWPRGQTTPSGYEMRKRILQITDPYDTSRRCCLEKRLPRILATLTVGAFFDRETNFDLATRSRSCFALDILQYPILIEGILFALSKVQGFIVISPESPVKLMLRPSLFSLWVCLIDLNTLTLDDVFTVKGLHFLPPEFEWLVVENTLTCSVLY